MTNSHMITARLPLPEFRIGDEVVLRRNYPVRNPDIYKIKTIMQGNFSGIFVTFEDVEEADEFSVKHIVKAPPFRIGDTIKRDGDEVAVTDVFYCGGYCDDVNLIYKYVTALHPDGMSNLNGQWTKVEKMAEPEKKIYYVIDPQLLTPPCTHEEAIKFANKSISNNPGERLILVAIEKVELVSKVTKLD